MKPNILVSAAAHTPNILASFAKAGVGIELSHFAYPETLDHPDLDRQVAEAREYLQDFPHDISMHGAFYDLNLTARDSRIRAACHYRIDQSLEIARQLKIDKVVFHSNYIHSRARNYKQIWTKKQIDFWQSKIATLEKYGIAIFIENTREEDASYISGILSGLNHPLVKTCYDTGHSHCFTRSKIRPVEWAKHYQEQLGYIHLHSNNGLADQHIPYTEGTEDFTGFFDAVRAINPMPHIIIEVKTKESYERSLEALKKEFGFE